MNLGRVLSQTIYVAPVTGSDSFGRATYGTPVARAARVETRRSMTINARGEEVATSHRLWTVEAVGLTDRVWLPGASTSSAEAALLPVAVSASSDFAGATTLYRVDL